MIFGIGFYVQLEKAKRDGSSPIPVFTRRLTGLLIGYCVCLTENLPLS
jgi:uncharacterized membrane protein YeiB